MRKVIIDGHKFEDVDFEDGSLSVKIDGEFFTYVTTTKNEGWHECDENGNADGRWVSDETGIMIEYALGFLYNNSGSDDFFAEENRDCYVDWYADMIASFLEKTKEEGFVKVVF